MGDMADYMYDMVFSGQVESDEQEYEIENRWKHGWHETARGDKIRIKDMTTGHIENTIRYFERSDVDVDTQPLKNELKKRNKN